MIPRDQQGFTLIEVLIATFLMAVLSSMGLLLLNSSINAKKQLDSTVAAVQSLELARVVLRSDLGQLVPRRVRGEYGGRAPDVFFGDGSGRLAPLMAFVSNGKERPDPETTYSSLQYLEYRLVDQALVRISRDRIDAAPGTQTVERVLLEGVVELEVEFYDGQDWTDAWGEAAGAYGSGSAPPLAVSFQLITRRYGRIPMMFATSAAYP